MKCINISYKVPKDNATEVEKVLKEHGEFMKKPYVKGSEAIHPLHTYFTKSEELIDPLSPEKGTTGYSIFTLNEIWNKEEDVVAHITRASQAPHFDRFYAANKYATVSLMGNIMYKLD